MSSMWRFAITPWVLFLAALAACTAMLPAARAATEEANVVRPADTSSPRATLKSFIDSCNEFHDLIERAHYFDRSKPQHYAPASRLLDCLDVSELPQFARDDIASEAAVCLKEILDRVKLPPYSEIPDIKAIEAAGGFEKLAQWRVPGTRITITRVNEGPRRHEYVFSPGTVSRAVNYYHDVQSLPYRKTGPAVSPGFFQWYVSAPGGPLTAAIVDRLPRWTRDRWLGVSIWKWAALCVASLLTLLMMGFAYRLQGTLADRYHDDFPFRYGLTIVLPIAAMLMPLVFKSFVRNALALRGTPLYVVTFLADVAIMLAALIVVFGVCNRIAAMIIASPKINPQGLDAQFIRIVAKLISMIGGLIVFLAGGQYLGIPVTTLLASAGIGGLAVALGAQDTLKTLFGTMTLLTDKPFRVGERIVVGKYDGFVEDIGLRSTKLRLLTGHQVAVPNDELARIDIENVGRRRHIRRIANIHIPLDTPREKLEKAVAAIRAAVANHEGMDPALPPRVCFFDFHPTAFVIRVIYWYNPPEYWDYLALSEKINFEIFRVLDEQQIQFSPPTRLTHTALD
jgi:MscS family membrane protein